MNFAVLVQVRVGGEEGSSTSPASHALLARPLQSLVPLLSPPEREAARAILETHPRESAAALGRMWARKLGLPPAAGPAAAGLWARLEPLLAGHPTDWTIFWRQLALLLPPLPPDAALAADIGGGGGGGAASSPPLATADALLAALAPAFYAPLPAAAAPPWLAWVAEWHASLRSAGVASPAADAAMRAANPKFVPREWMLVGAYTAAEAGDAGPLLALQALFREPYAERAGEEAEARFYRRQPDGAADKGGVGKM